MATPYTAGSYACFLQAKSKYAKTHISPDYIRLAFQNTANPVTEPKTKSKWPVPRQGAGLIQVDKAILSTGHFYPGKLVLGQTGFASSFTKTFKIVNYGSKPETYTLSSEPAASVSGDVLDSPVMTPSKTKIIFNPNRVTVPAGKEVSISAKFIPDLSMKKDGFWIYSGFIRATPSSDSGVELSLPYAGFKGDLKEVPLLDEEGTFLTVGGNNDVRYSTRNVTVRTTLDNEGDYVTLNFRLLRPSPQVIVTVREAGSYKWLGLADKMTFLGRNDNDPTNFFTTSTWDGSLKAINGSATQKTVPSGKYVLVVTFTKQYDMVNNNPLKIIHNFSFSFFKYFISYFLNLYAFI